jgi:histidinol-phosphate/aromatic aminotransferase/cobyric acid decarboxylase-like protein
MGKRLDDVHRRLVERDVLIRRMGDFPQAVGCARITVGTAEMNSAFLDALREAAG